MGCDLLNDVPAALPIFRAVDASQSHLNLELFSFLSFPFFFALPVVIPIEDDMAE